MSEQTKLFCLNNQNLFSNNYLQNRLPETDLWKTQKTKASAVFDEIRKAYESIRSLNLGPGEEAGLEDKFIRPVLRLLGYEWDVQPTTQRGLKKNRPDYALFKDKASLTEARKGRGQLEKFLAHSLGILEAKYWGRRLNDTDKKDLLDSRDPTAQTVKYLDSVNYHTNGKLTWAILTNGKLWRLFYFRASSRSGNYFEVDLEDVILREDVDAFLYFYLFFSKDAFLPDPVAGKTWLDQHLKGTEEYAVRISTKLKDLIFDKVFEGLAEGFVHFRASELSIKTETEDTRREIFKGCLTLLYRMLFLLYAESRDLLPLDEGGYRNVSLSKLRNDIDHDIKTSGIEKMSKRSYVYWARLEGLADIIAKGDPGLNVPVYNGGLFERPKDGFLSSNKIADPFLAEAIELLTVDSEGGYIDYSSLSVRHLGDIYEGLLEFHVQVADEETCEIKEKGKSLWKKATEIKKGDRLISRKQKGEVYIENSKHERKATGSYYTPHYIVEYIVKNAVGPVLEKRLETASNLLSKIAALSKSRKRQAFHGATSIIRNQINDLGKELFDTIFDIKVLDPAMGSGHFLVHAVDYISDRIITFLADYPDNSVVRKIDQLRQEIIDSLNDQKVTIDAGKLTEVNLIKRMVMKQCIYGVDLNEMAVELAKLSLWLDSFTLGAPLSFLDHHLKCGNSLIGVFDISDVIIPGSEMHGQVQRALSYLHQVSELTDATISQARSSHDFFKRGREAIEPILRRFDASAAKHFIDAGWSPRIEQLAYTLNYDAEPYTEVVETCKQALRIAGDKKFFHWKVEFPEVFYTEKGDRENPGFDCVIGNPPYGLLQKEVYFKQNYSWINPNWDLYIAFIERGISVTRVAKLVSYIVPVSWETGTMFERLREFLLKRASIRKIVNLPFDVFKDAYIDTGIIVVEKTENIANMTLVYEFPKKNRIDGLDLIPYREVEQLRWLGNKNQIILDTHALNILPRLMEKAHLLGEITVSVRGVLANDDSISDKHKAGYDPFFMGEMNRYELTMPDKFILYSEDLPERPSNINFFKDSRVLVRRLVNRQDRLMAAHSYDFFINKKDIYIFKNKGQDYSAHFLLSLLNSKLLSFLYLSQDTTSKKDDFRQVTLEGVRNLPISRISFTTPEKERKSRVNEAIELYKKYMIELEQEVTIYEKRKASEEPDRAVGSPDSGRKEGKVSGKHPHAGARVHGVRGRARKPEDAEGAHEDPEEYSPAARSTRFIESSLGIKSYSELAPYLAKEVERVMVSLLEKAPDELKVTPEFICDLHRDAFDGLFPSWAGRYRDRNVKVGNYEPPPYFEVPVLMRGYCDDLEFRLVSVDASAPVSEQLIEALAFAEGRLLSIHPFRDFNGRVTRMLLFALLRRFDLPPVPLVPDETVKDETALYLDALSEADRMNWQPLMAIWRKRLGLEASE